MNNCSKCIENDHRLMSNEMLIEAILVYLDERDPNFKNTFMRSLSHVNHEFLRKKLDRILNDS